ncbi:hypothetical protein N7448_007037 [Penicillium atrosanguineum]|uniref:Golgi apparatus membrane protein TVP18 n=1 Tax=Penicillium atrosanguineum TaxID=1132637 RepID=A0A9W9PSU9_9EURO|nr:uncharacterized protein N7443_010798 [Penicillium atrosanguineum]KAJ5132879.1 hypothetical protein N7448_007037 [Penicillium atrosanguineum]KAJ5141233.1 hypothetical protein N7526_002228 [Penicillium atrosanguineum]KAJ5290545.1 hypothetical protein N7443_010798 [Penicillium atrosanguineum]KAJ5308368.1 hypothetical protein N7476_009024 [Penicillium atrosanguineum]
MTLAEEFRSRNFSIYGQWTGVLCMILCAALGIANIFTLHAWHIVFAILCIISAPIILFVEVPFLLRICPTSGKFDEFIRRITTNWMRATMYVCLSAIQWASLVGGASSLIAAAVFLLIAALFYALAGLKSQEFIGSKTLGGQGIAQMIV